MKAWMFGILASFFLFGCTADKVPTKPYKTEYVVVLVVDGPRYTETWGEPTRQYVPYMDSALVPNACMHEFFYTNGVTKTVNGHSAITTGFYQEIDNTGLQMPDNPSFLQQWLKENPSQKDKAWIIASKDKLAVLGNCQSASWNNQFLPSTDCGVSGLGSGYRHDSITYQKTLQTLGNKHPKLLFVNFREPDFSGHQANWTNYLNGIQMTDYYVYKIWEFIQNDPIYKDKTTLFVTNDHGRHTDGIADGFVSHGDDCAGCKRISLLSFGPDFKTGFVTQEERNLVDIHATIVELLQLKNVSTSGEVMNEIFR